MFSFMLRSVTTTKGDFVADPYRKLTPSRIVRKASRKRNPATSLVQLAHELGINTSFTRSNGTVGHSAPTRFRNLVMEAMGPQRYNALRDQSKVR